MIDPNQGTFAVKLLPPAPKWWADNQEYLLAKGGTHGLAFQATKHSDQTLEIFIEGPLNQSFHLHGPCPSCPQDDTLHIAITWQDDALNLYLNGQPTQEFRPSEMPRS